MGKPEKGAYEETIINYDIRLNPFSEEVVLHGVIDGDNFYHLTWRNWQEVRTFIAMLNLKATQAFGNDTEE